MCSCSWQWLTTTFYVYSVLCESVTHHMDAITNHDWCFILGEWGILHVPRDLISKHNNNVSIKIKGEQKHSLTWQLLHLQICNWFKIRSFTCNMHQMWKVHVRQPKIPTSSSPSLPPKLPQDHIVSPTQNESTRVPNTQRKCYTYLEICKD